MNATTKTREPLYLTAEKAASESYRWVALKPDNFLKTDREIGELAKVLLTRMVRSGLFVITN